MALKSLVQRQVKAALRVIRDLGVSATLSDKVSQDYDFGEQQTTGTGITEKTITIVLQRTIKVGGDTSGFEASVICDTDVVGSLDAYDTLTFGGNTWNISGSEDDGYITTLTLNREA